MLRQGVNPVVVQARIEDAYHTLDDNRARRLVERAQRGLEAVDTLKGIKGTRVVDIGEVTGQGAGCQAVRAGITLRFYDTESESERVFKFDASLRPRGVLRSILKQALQAALQDAADRNYLLPFITLEDDMFSGDGYNIDYVECR